MLTEPPVADRAGWVALDAKRLPDSTDAHAVWAELSAFRAPRRRRVPGAPRAVPVSVLIELADEMLAADVREPLAQLVQAAGVYRLGEGQRFLTGLVGLQRLDALAAHPAVSAWRIGRAEVAQVDAAPLPPPVVVDDSQVGLPFIGIIDNGIAFAHRAFRDAAGRSRILRLWDQDAQRLQPANNAAGRWRAVSGMGYGGQIEGADIDAIVAASRSDDEVYRRLQYPSARRRVTHGTHVLDLAAGSRNPLRPAGATPAGWDGVASRAPIIAVQLPDRSTRLASGGPLGEHVLDALHYIAACAGPGRQVVINLSDGAYGGPHDGTSLVERAVDQFLARHPHVVLVLAAGNAHESRLHAQLRVDASAGSRPLHWRVLPDDATHSVLELWFDGPPLAAGDAWIRLTPPGGWPATEVDLGQAVAFMTPQGAAAAVVTRLRSANAVPRRTQVLVALGPTNQALAPVKVPHGIWTLEVFNRSAAAIDVHAWIERDDPGPDEPGLRRQSYFVDDRCRPLAVQSGRTLNSLAGGRESVVVGACYWRGAAFSGCDARAATPASRYSSRGPGRCDGVGPDLVAPGDDSPTLRGLRAAASRSGVTCRMDGTSVAAGVVTRRTVNMVAQVGAAALRAGVKQARVPPPGDAVTRGGLQAVVLPGQEP
jgi:hypothetical protein